MQLLRVMFQPNSYKHYIIARLETNLHHLPKEKGGSLESLIKQFSSYYIKANEKSGAGCRGAIKNSSYSLFFKRESPSSCAFTLARSREASFSHLGLARHHHNETSSPSLVVSKPWLFIGCFSLSESTLPQTC